MASEAARRERGTGPGPAEYRPPSVRYCGIDEAGRGPLAGPVFAAAVILDPANPIEGLRDSKKIGPNRRDQLFVMILNQSLACSIAQASVAEIDELNVLQATLLAMRRAVELLPIPPLLALVDGNKAPVLRCETRTLVRGDGLDPAISAASILAKVARDRDMLELHRAYPDYGFDAHKGYPTALHLERLRRFGPSAVHRQSFGPVREAAIMAGCRAVSKAPHD
ncbi:MAG: ribonuclease HII [Burkholderiaceae bacterium]|nr:ribonuclease HII [Burkholderiaceae bacterium]